jgi:hypothetical protein
MKTAAQIKEKVDMQLADRPKNVYPYPKQTKGTWDEQ